MAEMATVKGSIKYFRKRSIDSATRELIDRLLLERISLAGIARAAQVSEQWLQTYVNEKYAVVPRQVQVTKKKGEADDSMRRIVVIRQQQREQAVGLAGAGCEHSRDCRSLHWRTG